MIYFILYKNGNLRYGQDLSAIRASVNPPEDEAEVHAVDNPIQVLAAQVLAPLPSSPMIDIASGTPAEGA
jgi:hypothetical protein